MADLSSGTMQKVVVLTDSESATGFRLAGSEVIDVTPEKAVAELERMVMHGNYGLIAVDQSLIPDPAKAVERAMRGQAAVTWMNGGRWTRPTLRRYSASLT